VEYLLLANEGARHVMALDDLLHGLNVVLPKELLGNDVEHFVGLDLSAPLNVNGPPLQVCAIAAALIELLHLRLLLQLEILKETKER
jgi:hypothetical protein